MNLAGSISTSDAWAAVSRLCLGLIPQPREDEIHIVPEGQLPDAIGRLLGHTHHMTPTLKAFHGGDVALKIFREAIDGDWYRRHIALTAPATGGVVEVGLVRIHMTMLAAAVQRDILHRRTPLGDILLQHRVMTQVKPLRFLRWDGQSEIVHPFNAGEAVCFYGRLAVIYCDGQGALELLEVVTDRRGGFAAPTEELS